ncbi:MAG: cysteine--tRNA ligase [Acidimicrobiia bacterium]|nr:cysteine--tRNA ligase [Acidimicrobiia bacterium]MYG58960.1 cysteine--tRNA ligase [Acidimicrobiia bacterium]MYJ32150.1 cysteine--tRNA ligase [Acidimicrobiia bacterium]MYJ33137.1 cysteine--tRNA ligase [Acidimicrobiia bacterium]
MVSFYDTRRREIVPFEPLVEGRVSMYVCGPTVYDDPHVGHARTALTFDMMRRYLQWRGFEVTFVSNITDIDDNIINRASETGTTEPELAARYEQVYVDQMDRFGIARPDHRPHATEYVTEMLDFIGDLVDRGAAYAIEGKGVYFSVAAHDRYGDLIGRTPDELREGAGARVEVDVEKVDPLDFALWKAAKPGEPVWDSPWGPGRPGWHIECVAMATDLLGETFDIHGGGDDLAFPHHQNEVAEAEGADLGFARHWIHGAMLNVNGEKMAKSLGNFTTLSDLLDAFEPQVLRLLMLQTHYRTVMELSDDALTGAAGALDRLRAWHRRAAAAGLEPAVMPDAVAVARFTTAMDDDFGTPAGLAVVFDLVREANAALDAEDTERAATAHATVCDLAGALGLALASDDHVDDDALSAEVEKLLAERDEARMAKDFASADRIRDELADRGIVLEDTPGGTIWRKS